MGIATNLFLLNVECEFGDYMGSIRGKNQRPYISCNCPFNICGPPSTGSSSPCHSSHHSSASFSPIYHRKAAQRICWRTLLGGHCPSAQFPAFSCSLTVMSQSKPSRSTIQNQSRPVKLHQHVHIPPQAVHHHHVLLLHVFATNVAETLSCGIPPSIPSISPLPCHTSLKFPFLAQIFCVLPYHALSDCFSAH